MKKRFLAMFLALVMCLALLPAAALADEQEMTIEDGVLTECYGSGHITIPDTVTRIENMAFWYNKGITGVTIPNSVTSIGTQAFQGCSNLTNVVIPDGITAIESAVFYGCRSLTSVVIPNSVTAIGDNAFELCSTLSKVTIPDNVTSIGMCAFRGCKALTSINFPNALISIGPDAFQYCESLTSVTFPDSLTSISGGAFYGCTSLTGVTFPKGVSKIAGFQNCTSLTEVVIVNDAVTISDHAFVNCSGLTKLTIPVSVTNIEKYAFYDCTALKDVYYMGTQAQWQNVKVDADGNAPFLAAAVHCTGPSTQPTTPTTPAAPATATAAPTNDKLTVNGSTPNATIYKIGGNNYFKLRDVAAMLNGTGKQFNVGYDTATKSANIITGQGYTKEPTDLLGAAASSQTATLSNDSVLLNGKKIEATVYKIGGNNYFKLRDLGQALDFYVGWNAQDGAFIDTSKPYSE